MRIKEDHMGNGQLKPFLDEVRQNLLHTYKRVIADSGYESEENYVYLEENKQLAFIKSSNYEISKTKKYKTDISRRENMNYDPEHDCYICSNGKRLNAVGKRKSKSKTGYTAIKTIYNCESCDGCSFKTKCIKGHNSKIPLEERTKHLEVSKVFQKKREECLERIVSDEGIELRKISLQSKISLSF